MKNDILIFLAGLVPDHLKKLWEKQNKTLNIFIKRKFVASSVNGFRIRYLSPVGTVP